jgi:PEP-CTERM motif
LKLRIPLFTLLCLALAAISANAQQDLYDNGPLSGTVDAWTINFGYIVSDTFNITSGTINGFAFNVWEFPGDTMTSVQWSITSGENSGTVYNSGVAQSSPGPPNGGTLTDMFKTVNQYGFDIDLITVTGINGPLLGSGGSPSGTTYWLNLQNATVPSGDPVYWDENSGVGCGGSGCPSQASESSVGTIASESFTITDGSSGTTPEPSSVLLFGSGILGLGGVLRRKLF